MWTETKHLIGFGNGNSMSCKKSIIERRFHKKWENHSIEGCFHHLLTLIACQYLLISIQVHYYQAHYS